MARRDRNRAMQDKLAERLKEEADRNRVDFSPALHDRIMHSVARFELAKQTKRPVATGAVWWLATAAVVLVAVGATLLMPTNSPSPDLAGAGAGNDESIRPLDVAQVPSPIPSKAPSQVATQDPALSASEAEVEPQDLTDALYFVAVREIDEVRESELLVESMLAADQISLLDHDARLAADWVLAPITLALAVSQ